MSEHSLDFCNTQPGSDYGSEDSDTQFENFHSNDNEAASHKAWSSRLRFYNLRPSARDGKAAWITWLDTDNSGNYDPSKSNCKQKNRNLAVQSHAPQRSIGGKVGVDEVNNKQPCAARLSCLAARRNGRSCVVSLDVKSPPLRAVATAINNNWPGVTSHNILSDEYYKQLADQINRRSGDWYSLRSRLSSQTAALSTGDNLEDPARVEDDLRNHPSARGCKACRSLLLHCTLLDDERVWPCYPCNLDNIDCELIQPLTKRMTCEDCRQKRVQCSYTTEGDPTKPCTRCADIGITCIAGPDLNGITKRIRYEQDYSISNPVQSQRRFVTCTACRKQKISCSLRRKTDQPPCDSCDDQGINCTFERVPRKRKLYKQSEDVAKDNAREEALWSRSGTAIPVNAHIIHTALAHPIQFSHLEDSECDWCTNGIGIFGYGWNDVLVVPSPDGLSFTEVDSSHNSLGSDGHYASRMCAHCTMSRCHVLACVGHETRPLDGLATLRVQDEDNSGAWCLRIQDDFDIAGLYSRLEDNKVLPSDKWCALCPAPALYQCCTTQENDMWGEAVDPYSNDAEGCGLVLCEECKNCLEELGGSLERTMDMINGSSGTDDVWVLGLRADAELLRQDGLLIRNVLGDDRGGDDDEGEMEIEV